MPVIKVASRDAGAQVCDYKRGTRLDVGSIPTRGNEIFM